MLYISLYVLLYVFILVAILTKIKRKEKVNPFWYVVLFVLTVIPIVLLIFDAFMPVQTRETITNSR